VDAGERTERTIQATVLKRNEDLDFALLQAQAPGNCPSIRVEDEKDLIETMPVVMFGFPFGKDLAVANAENPSISVSMLHVTALRKDKGELETIRVDGSVNPGNSGGPLVAENGQVLGVVEATVEGANLNTAVPCSQISEFLASCVFASLQAPALSLQNISERQDFAIQARRLDRGTDPLSVVLTLQAGTGQAHACNAVFGQDGLYHLQVAVAQGGDKITESPTYRIVVSRGQWGQACSPGGKMVAFLETMPDMHRLCVANVDGSNLQQVSPSVSMCRSAWSPDSKRLLFVHDAQIYVVNLNGTGEACISDGNGSDGYPCWLAPRAAKQ
jgi:hypothetical protein